MANNFNNNIINFQDLSDRYIKVLNLKRQVSILNEQITEELNHISHEFNIKTPILRVVMNHLNKSEKASQTYDEAIAIIAGIKNKSCN